MIEIKTHLLITPSNEYKSKTKEGLIRQIASNRIYTVGAAKKINYKGFCFFNTNNRIRVFICWKHRKMWFGESYDFDLGSGYFKSIVQKSRDFELIPNEGVTFKIKTNRLN
ncbi:MAG: hypothetical protein JHC31_06320 [Sulfurihydrogenibium sp.]|nr:hypothetical protein [Sulfurihydrogenibium sp.]